MKRRQKGMTDLHPDVQAWLDTTLFGSSGTPSTYAWGVRAFFRFLNARGIEYPALNSNVLQEFSRWLSEEVSPHSGKPLAPLTRQNYLASTIEFLRFALEQHRLPNDFSLDTSRLRLKQRRATKLTA